jgi:hypothetical protein
LTAHELRPGSKTSKNAKNTRNNYNFFLIFVALVPERDAVARDRND